MEAVFRHRLAEARARGRIAAALAWLNAARDLMHARPVELLYQWRRRGRVGPPRERRPHMIGSDLLYAWRAIMHQKLGSGLVGVDAGASASRANVAVFSLINGLFLRPLPFPEPERLVYLNETAPRWNLEMTGITYADFAQWQKAQQAFEAIALYNRRSFNVATDDGADRMDGASVTADFARVLGIEPVIGRMFTAEEDRPNGPNVALIGTAVWHERFGGRADVLGQTIRLNSRQFTIIGVLPQSAEFPGGVRLWTPMQGDPDLGEQLFVRRRRAGSSRASRWSRARPICCARISRSSTRATRRKSSRRSCATCAQHLTGDYDTIVSTLGAAVSLLLIVACANVAAVMLARALARRREMGIRLAVGASRVRLLRQLLVENLILSAVGGAIGLLIGQLGRSSC